MLGIGESAGFPCVSKLLASAVPVKSLGTANGIVAFGYLFGPAVGSYCGGLLMVHFGWRAAFWVFGALSLLWLLPWSRVRLPPGAAPAGAAHVRRCRRCCGSRRCGARPRTLLDQLRVLFHADLAAVHRGARARLLDRGHGALTGSAYVVNALVALARRLGDRSRGARCGTRTSPTRASWSSAHVGSVACMLCMAIGPPPWALGAIFVYQVLIGMSSPGVFAMSQILAGPTRGRRAGSGIQNGVGNLAGVIAPALTGWLIGETHHFTAAFVVAAAVSLFGLVGWVWMVPRLAPLPWPAAGAARTPEPAASLLL